MVWCEGVCGRGVVRGRKVCVRTGKWCEDAEWREKEEGARTRSGARKGSGTRGSGARSDGGKGVVRDQCKDWRVR